MANGLRILMCRPMNQDFSRFWRQCAAPLMGGAYSVGQFVRRNVLKQITDGAGFERVVDEVIFFETGKDKDLHVRIPLPYLTRSGGSIHTWHDQIHQNDIGQKALAEAYGLLAISGLADQFKVVIGIEEGRQST